MGPKLGKGAQAVAIAVITVVIAVVVVWVLFHDPPTSRPRVRSTPTLIPTPVPGSPGPQGSPGRVIIRTTPTVRGATQPPGQTPASPQSPPPPPSPQPSPTPSPTCLGPLCLKQNGAEFLPLGFLLIAGAALLIAKRRG